MNNNNLLSANNLINDVLKPNFSNNKIIEKYIDFKDNNNYNQRNKNNSWLSKSLYNITPKSINCNT